MIYSTLLSDSEYESTEIGQTHSLAFAWSRVKGCLFADMKAEGFYKTSSPLQIGLFANRV